MHENFKLWVFHRFASMFFRYSEYVLAVFRLMSVSLFSFCFCLYTTQFFNNLGINVQNITNIKIDILIQCLLWIHKKDRCYIYVFFPLRVIFTILFKLLVMQISITDIYEYVIDKWCPSLVDNLHFNGVDHKKNYFVCSVITV